MLGRLSPRKLAVATTAAASTLAFQTAATCEDATSRLDAMQQQLQRIENQLQKQAGGGTTRPTPIHWADHALEPGILYDAATIQERVQSLGAEISRDYAGKEVVVVGLLSGVFIFMADLVRNITVPHKMDFCVVSSYGKGTVSSGNVKIKKDLERSITGKHVLIVDEMCDSGTTMACLKALLETRGAASVRTCVLLHKAERTVVPVDLDYVGMICPDEFVVGYGMDFAEDYRSLPYIGIVKREMYMK